MIFDAKVLDELKSEKSGASKQKYGGVDPLITPNTGFIELERAYHELEVKYKDQ